MASSGDNVAPIIIKKVKKGGGHGHHGGAWKVAYADFVTAMMAFFLLLWLLASTSEEQRQGLADYFTPTVISESTTSGSGDILGGRTLTTEGSARDDRTPMGVIVTPGGEGAPDATGEDEGSPEQVTAEDGAGPADGQGAGQDGDAQSPGALDQEALENAVAAREEEEFERIAEELRTAVAAVPELNALADNLMIDQTPEGLRIQIVDRQGTSMFASGSALPLAHTRTLLGLVANAVGKLPNRIAVKGHTDSTPFRGEGNYSNWELSSDRAHASRRALLASGLPEERVAYVVGKSDQEPLDPDDPFAAVNRRISIVLLRDGAGDGQAGLPAPEPLAPAFEPPSLLQRSQAPAPVPAPAASSATPASQTVVGQPGDPFANVLTFGTTQ